MSYDLSQKEIAQVFEDLRAAQRTIKELQNALQTKREHLEIAERVFIRMVKWLRGEDVEFGRWIVEARSVINERNSPNYRQMP